MVVALTERELRQEKIVWILTRLMNFQTTKPKWGFMSLSVLGPMNVFFVSFFLYLFSHMSSSLVWEGKKECERGKNWSFFFLKKKLTLQDWITMFSFFVLVVLLDARLFLGRRVSFQ